MKIKIKQEAVLLLLGIWGASLKAAYELGQLVVRLQGEIEEVERQATLYLDNADQG